MSELNLCLGNYAEIIPSEDIEKNESRWGNEYAEYGVFIALRKD